MKPNVFVLLLMPLAHPGLSREYRAAPQSSCCSGTRLIAVMINSLQSPAQTAPDDCHWVLPARQALAQPCCRGRQEGCHRHDRDMVGDVSRPGPCLLGNRLCMQTSLHLQHLPLCSPAGCLTHCASNSSFHCPSRVLGKREKSPLECNVKVLSFFSDADGICES